MIRADNREPGRVEAVVVDAHQRAQQIVRNAEEHAAGVQARAEARGRAAADAALAAELVRLGDACDRELSTLHDEAVGIAFAAAKRIVGRELAERPEGVREIVAGLLARLRRARRVTLRVHPDDHAALAGRLSEVCGAADWSGILSVEVDPAISRGGCVLHSDIGSLDARVETQLAALQRALRESRTR